MVIPTHSLDLQDELISDSIKFVDSMNSTRQMQFAAFEESSGVQAVDDIAVSSTMTALWINFLVFFVLVGLYELFSRIFPSVYAVRRLSGEKERLPVQLTSSYLPLSWVPSVASIPWPQVLKDGGLDAYMFLRYIRMCLVITTVSGFWGFVILFPVYATGGGGAEGWYFLSMANIVNGSYRLWLPTIFMWFLTFFVFYLMNEEYKHYYELRMDFLAGRDIDDKKDSQHLYSLAIDNIPHHLRSNQALFEYFDDLFPGNVHSASVIMNIPDLEVHCDRRTRVLRRLEKSIAIYEATGKRAKHVVGRGRITCFGIESLPINPIRGRKYYKDDYDESLPKPGEVVDSISYYTRDLVDMNEKVGKLQEEKMQIALLGNEKLSASARLACTLEKIRKDGLLLGFRDAETNLISFFLRIGMGFFFGGFSLLDHHLDVVVDSVEGNDMSSFGFVTFKNLATVTSAASTRAASATILKASPAPEPRNIVWENAHIDSTILSGREFTTNCLLILGVIFWSVPVASIQALATVEKIAYLPGMEWIMEFSGGRFAAIINGYLPVLGLLGLINLLPIIFSWIAVRYENRKTFSDVENSILGRFFYYQLANIYITVTAASLWDSIGDILDKPSFALTFLGQTLPTVVGYFIALLITKVLAGLPLVMLRPMTLIRMLLIKACFMQNIITQRELDEVYRHNQTISYGWEYPIQLLVIVICFTYTCISPIILPVGAIYFLFALIVYKKQCLLVYSPKYEDGGQMFSKVCSRTLIGLICGQISLLGYMLIKHGLYELFFLLPLPFLTLNMMKYFNRIYAKPSSVLSLERAKELDSQCKEDMEKPHQQFTKDAYRQPSLVASRLEPMPYRRKSSKGPRLFYREQSREFSVLEALSTVSGESEEKEEEEDLKEDSSTIV